MLISMWKSPARAQLTSYSSTLFCSLHHLCATLFFSSAILSCRDSYGSRKIIPSQISNDEARSTILSCFLKLLILNEQPRVFLQYHFGGLSRCTLIVSFGSVLPTHCPYPFHPSPLTLPQT